MSIAARIVSMLTPPVKEVPLRSLALLRREVAATQGLVLDVGCGTRRIGEGVIRTDIEAFAGIDVRADGCRLPFKSDTFDLVVCSEVLEHVPDWSKARDEIVRVTRPGGRIMLDVPFIYPYHASPPEDGHDYIRWTPRGLRRMFARCEIIQEGLVVGHGSMLCVILREFIARLFLTRNHSAGYHIVLGWASWLLYPLTWLDGWLDAKPRNTVSGGAYYILVRKPATASSSGSRGAVVGGAGIEPATPAV